MLRFGKDRIENLDIDVTDGERCRVNSINELVDVRHGIKILPKFGYEEINSYLDFICTLGETKLMLCFAGPTDPMSSKFGIVIIFCRISFSFDLSTFSEFTVLCVFIQFSLFHSNGN